MCVFNVDRQHLWQSQSVSGTSSNSAHSRWNHKWRRSHWTHSSMDSSPEPGGTTLRQRAVFSIFSRRRCLLLLPFGLLGLSLFLLLCQLDRLSGITPAATRSFWWATLLMLHVGQGVWVTVDVSVGLVLGWVAAGLDGVANGVAAGLDGVLNSVASLPSTDGSTHTT